MKAGGDKTGNEDGVLLMMRRWGLGIMVGCMRSSTMKRPRNKMMNKHERMIVLMLLLNNNDD